MTTLAHPSVEAALELLERAREDLLAASHTAAASTRYLRAQRAALRAAAALVAARCAPDDGRSRGGPRTVWDLLPTVAPELGEWAQFLAGPTLDRPRIERGEVTVGHRAADDLLRQAETFLVLVTGSLGLPVDPHARTTDVLAPLALHPHEPAPGRPLPRDR